MAWWRTCRPIWIFAFVTTAARRSRAPTPCDWSERLPVRRYWGDLHGQSGETVGTNPAETYFRYARDKAFIDIVGHQGNDFQITDAFWVELNRLTAAFDRPGKFVCVPGYEWSGNTGMGGDRNVFFRHEGRPIRRSSRILVDPESGGARDCYTARDLFGALDGEDAIVIAHVGGRYADISVAHDGRLERAVEVHSTWGTFEWLLHDAFERLPGRRRLSQRRPQGAARRHPPRRVDLRDPRAMRVRRETVEHPFGTIKARMFGTIKARMGATHFLMKTLPRVSGEMALQSRQPKSPPCPGRGGLDVSLSGSPEPASPGEWSSSAASRSRACCPPPASERWLFRRYPRSSTRSSSRTWSR